MPDLLRTEANERIDINDWLFTTVQANDAAMRWIADQFLTDPLSSTRTWILQGFAPTYSGTGQQVKVVRGVAILAYRDAGALKFGALCNEGDVEQIIDITGYTNGTYSIYIRFEYVDGDQQNRVFWNPTAPGSEFSRNIATRQLAGWSTRIESGSPGGEWTKIGQVVKSGGAPVVSDYRSFFFEGNAHTSYANTWGTGNDRNANRAAYGVQDLQTFTAAMRTQLSTIMGSPAKWYEVPILSLQDVYDEMDNWVRGSGMPAINPANKTNMRQAQKCWTAFDQLDRAYQVRILPEIARSIYISGTACRVVGEYGMIQRSADIFGGPTAWIAETPAGGYAGVWNKIRYASLSPGGARLLVVGASSVQWEYYASPDTWTAIAATPAVTFYDVVDDGDIGLTRFIFVGAGGKLYKFDGSWTLLTAAAGYTGTFHSICRFWSGPRMLACGTSGEIQLSTNHGTTWTRVHTGGADLYNLLLVGGTVVVAVGPNGSQYSNDSGATWSDAWLHGVQVLVSPSGEYLTIQVGGSPSQFELAFDPTEMWGVSSRPSIWGGNHYCAEAYGLPTDPPSSIGFVISDDARLWFTPPIPPIAI